MKNDPDGNTIIVCKIVVRNQYCWTEFTDVTSDITQQIAGPAAGNNGVARRSRNPESTKTLYEKKILGNISFVISAMHY